MSYKCKRAGCGKTSYARSGLRCSKCDAGQAAAQGMIPIYAAPPNYSETSSDSDSRGFSSGCGGDFGGGGASGGWDSGSSSSGGSD